jgi:hypothetical protein
LRLVLRLVSRLVLRLVKKSSHPKNFDHGNYLEKIVSLQFLLESPKLDENLNYRFFGWMDEKSYFDPSPKKF